MRFCCQQDDVSLMTSLLRPKYNHLMGKDSKYLKIIDIYQNYFFSSYKLTIIQVLIIQTKFLNTFFDKWHIIRRCGSNVYHVISHQTQYAASTQSKTDFSLLYVS